MQRAGRGSIGELADRLDDAAPARCALGVADGCELVGPSGAFFPGRTPVPLQHQVSGVPDVDLGHLPEEARRGSPINV
jgi:hypothetical protein